MDLLAVKPTELEAMSAFTALNGGSPKASEPPSIKVDSSAADEQQQHKAPSEGPSNQADGFERHPLQTKPYQDATAADGSLKRKRSIEVDVRRDGPLQERTPDTATVPPHGDRRDPFGTPQREYRQYSPDNRDKDHWYSQQSREERASYDGRHHSAASPQDEDQTDEGRRRANSQGDHGDYQGSSPEADDRSNSMYGGQYTPEHRQGSVLQHGDPKKRKRNFSNRTKTGCMTCRKRKKKCDEQKPECRSRCSSCV